MAHTANAAPLEKQLRPGHFLHWQGRRYRLLPGDACDPLTIRLEDIATLEKHAVRIEELLLPKGDVAEPIFAPTLEALQAELERRYPPPQPLNVNGLPNQLVRQADSIVANVEMVERLVAAEAGRVALGRDGQTKFLRLPAVRRACEQLAEPIGLTTYCKYRRLYRKCHGDRLQIAAALRRSTFNQTKMSPAQLHFVDVHIMRFYARSRSIRPRPMTVYHIARSTLECTNGLWLAPGRCKGPAPENVVEELLDPKLPMRTILDNPEKAGRLAPIEIPSRSWFYQYLRWFEHQPEHGQAIMTARYGKDMWERESWCSIPSCAGQPCRCSTCSAITAC
jgi:hypothetical protein